MRDRQRRSVAAPPERRPGGTVHGLRDLASQLGNQRFTAVVQRGPTHDNLPREMPESGARVELREEGGKWREFVGTSRRTASGAYDFVVQNGKIYAVKHDRRLAAPIHAEPDTATPRGGGHTQAARGGPVGFAGQVFITGSGTLKEWNDGSGHYRPVSTFEQFRRPAIDAGLPNDKFVPHPDNAPDRRSGPGPQLPVHRPEMKSPDGRPAKVGPGPPRMAEFEAAHGRLAKAPSAPSAAPTLNARAIATSALTLIAGIALSGFTERATQTLIDRQVAKLQPEIDRRARDAIAEVVPPEWFVTRPLPLHLVVVLDVWRQGIYDGDLHDYIWGGPVVSIERVFVTPTRIGINETFGPVFEREGLGVLTEHHYASSVTDLWSLLPAHQP